MLDDAKKPLVSVRDLKMHFPIYAGLFRRRVGEVKAVDGVSFDVFEGETLGLVGESGCGKSTCGRAVLRLYDITEGSISIDGKEIGPTPQPDLRPMRPTMQMVFQDPQASLNPRMTVEDIIKEPLDEHTTLTDAEKRDKVGELMDAVGLNRKFAKRYPHAFSGGQRQRIGIARALALNPKFIVCDEPIAALDVSIQAQVVNLLEDLQEQFGLTYLFISHDLSVVRHMSSRIGVLYLGKLVEVAEGKTLFESPRHPYTKMLLDAVPDLDMTGRKRKPVEGEIPNPIDPPSGCAFHPRCGSARDICLKDSPELLSDKGGDVACFAVADTQEYRSG